MASPKQLDGPKGPLYDPLGRFPIEGAGTALACGSGISTGAGTLYRSFVSRQGGTIVTEIYIDLTGLKSGASAGDIIGVSAAANCHLGQVTTANCGTIYKGEISCLEAPATGEPDIDVAVGSIATGTQDAAASGLTGYVLNSDAAADYTVVGTTKVFTAVPAANFYLYLVASGGADTAVYTAGIFLIRLYGFAL